MDTLWFASPCHKPFVTIAHGAQNTDFVGHGLVLGLWGGCAHKAHLGAALDHHLVVIGASISLGTTKRSRLWFCPRVPLLHGRQARFRPRRACLARPGSNGKGVN
jgi:hypothetical protein